MKTGDFINALVQDHGVSGRRSGGVFVLQMVAGVALSFAIFFHFLGVRADFLDAMTNPHVVFKFMIASALFGSLLPISLMAAQPENRLSKNLRWQILPCIILFSGILYQLLTSPSDEWFSGMMGRYPLACLQSIPVLALGPLLILLLMLKSGAPAHPTQSGAIAGATAGGMAAFIYALHCPDDSALFVALWYSLAVAFVSLCGALIGRCWLRW